MSLQQRTAEGVTWLTFDRPERLNSFTAEDYRDLRVAFEGLADDDATRVVVVTATGRAFSAGADRSLLDGSATSELDVGDEFRRLLDAVMAVEVPLIGAVNGLAIGFGSNLLLHCDLVLLAESARLRYPFTALGLTAEAGSSVLLPARTRFPDAMWAMLSSEWVDAPTALSMGLAWRVVPDDELAEAAGAAAATIAAQDLASVKATKALLRHGEADLVRAAVDREFEAFGRLQR